jgi:hypothetical protein
MLSPPAPAPVSFINTRFDETVDPSSYVAIAPTNTFEKGVLKIFPGIRHSPSLLITAGSVFLNPLAVTAVKIATFITSFHTESVDEKIKLTSIELSFPLGNSAVFKRVAFLPEIETVIIHLPPFYNQDSPFCSQLS